MAQHQRNRRQFAAEAEKAQPGIVEEFWDFLSENKNWWLTPIIIVLLLAGLMAVMGGSGVGPFIYALF